MALSNSVECPEPTCPQSLRAALTTAMRIRGTRGTIRGREEQGRDAAVAARAAVAQKRSGAAVAPLPKVAAERADRAAARAAVAGQRAAAALDPADAAEVVIKNAV